MRPFRLLLSIASVVVLPHLLHAHYWQEDVAFSPALEGTSAVSGMQLITAPGGRAIVATAYAIDGMQVRGTPRRLNADGTIDRSFQPPMDTALAPLAAYADGRVLVIRGIGGAGGQVNRLLRLNADGTIDPSFTPTDVSDWFKARILSDGRIVVYSYLRTVNGTPEPGICILKSDGSIDPSFHATLTSLATLTIYDVLPQADGRFVVSGSNFTATNGVAVSGIARLNADGTVDSSFAVPAPQLPYTPARLYAGASGTVIVLSGKPMRLTPTGAIDATYTAQPVGSVISFYDQQPDGHILYVTNNAGKTELRRLNTDGTADPSFVLSTDSYQSYTLSTPVAADDGTIYVPTALTAARQLNRNTLSHLNADGALDTAFAPTLGSAATLDVVQPQPDGKVLVSGLMAHVNGVAYTGTRSFVRLNADGSTDTSFAATVGTNESISHLFVQPSGRIVAQGYFPDGTTSHSIVRFNADGSRDTSFVFPVASPWLFSVDGDGAIYTADTSTSTHVVRYTPDGAVDATFQAALTATPGVIMPLSDGTVVVVQNQAFVRLRHDGSADASYHVPVASFSGTLLGEAALPNGALAVFTSEYINYGTHFSAYRINNAGQVDYTYVGPQTGASQFLDYLSVGGILYDLLHAANLAANAIAQANFSANLVAANAAGQVLIRNVSNFTDGQPRRYVRPSASAPSGPYAPALLFTSTAPTNALPLGRSTFFQVTASGLWPLTYAWTKDGVPIIGATTNTLVLRNVQVGDAADYAVTVSNAYGTVTSKPWRFTVDPSVSVAVIVQQPGDTTVQTGGTATLAVTATGTPAPTYQWWFNNQAIAGATNASLTIPNAQAANAGRYYVALTTKFSTTSSWTVYSALANLTVMPFPPGTYFGKVGAGDVAIMTHGNGTADLLMNLAASGRIIVAKGFALGSDGGFSASGTSYTTGQALGSGSAVTITGAFRADGTVSGSISSEALGFSAAKTSDAVTGSYQAQGLGTNAGGVYAVSDASGRTVAVGISGGAVFGGSGSTNAGALMTTSVDGGVIMVTLSPSTGVLSATGSGGAVDGATWAGLSDSTARTDRLADISTRCEVGAGDNTLIAGFVVAGSTARPVLIRAVGPTLANFGVGTALATPHLTVYRNQTVIGSGDSWSAAPNAAQIASTGDAVGAFPLTTGSADAAVLALLDPGTYSVGVTSADGSSGVAMVEVYDAGPAAPTSAPRLINISSRGHVGVGEDALIAGFVVTGNAPKPVLIRGIGPALAPYGISSTLADPVVTLRQGQTTILANDDWSVQTGEFTAADIQAAGDAVGAFSLTPGSRDAAMLITLQPGLYTATVNGKGDSAGVGMLEVYELPEK